ncbi:MAG: O-antigen ligase family protein [candidate division Zixibacteria bacterium]|nr:O-antigen ligase family protein [candidate division Zixibacteria bacterium]
MNQGGTRLPLSTSGMVAVTIVLLLPSIALLLAGKTLLALAPIAAATCVIIVSHPRLAVYQYVFAIFIQWVLVDSIPLLLTDVAAALVILAATLDLLVDHRLPLRFPRLTLNFAVLIAAVFVAGMVGSNPTISLRVLARLTFLMLSFLSIYRLAGKSRIDTLVRVFFWVCVGHALIVLGGFIATGGGERSWGFSPMTFNALAMMTLPVATSLYLWHRKSGAVWYLLGTAVVLGGLISTQSRFSIIFALIMSLLVVILSWRYHRRLRAENRQSGFAMEQVRVSLRCRWLVIGAAGLTLAVIGLNPGMLQGVVDRFTVVLESPTGSTVFLRLTLWSFALKAFLSDPLTGIGPGCFRSIHHILPTLSLSEVGPWVRGLSAHNLFLHYLAEAGLIGGISLAALMINQFRLSRRIWSSQVELQNRACTLALYATGTLFVVTTFLETGWLWGQGGYAFAFFVAMIARQHSRKVNAEAGD